MGQSIQKIKGVGTMNLDVSEKYLQATESRYNLNFERTVNNKGAGVGGNDGINTPAPGNRAVPINGLPDGINTKIGACNSKKTNENYIFLHNSLGNHCIYRINPDGTTEIVLIEPTLPFSLNPKYTIDNRCHLWYNHNSFIEENNKLARKYLTFTNGLGWQGFLDVETSIATNGFRTPYFSTTDRSQYWQLPTRPSLECIQGSFIAINSSDAAEISASNFLKEKSWQFRVRYVYTDGRTTSWSPISGSYMLDVFQCQSDAQGLPRCINLKVPVGGAQVEKIVLAFRNCAGNFTTDQNPDWSEYDTIEKYQKCLDSDTPFFQRIIRQDLNYNSATNTFDYVFCGDKKCLQIARTETNLNYIGIPLRSFAMAPLDDRLMLLNNVKDYNMIDCSALGQLDFSVVEPVGTDCAVEMATVTVAIIIHNLQRSVNEFVFINEDNGADDTGLQKFFGGLGPRDITTAYDDPGPYKQYFGDISGSDPNQKSGFIVYPEGTDVYGISKQSRCYGGNSYADEAVVGNMKAQYIRRRVSRDLSNNSYYYIQLAQVKVIKGTKGYMRIASHLAKKTDIFQNTSTTVVGVFRDRNAYNSTIDIDGNNTDFFQKELYFDTCSGDADLSSTPFIVADLSGPYSDVFRRKSSTGFTGYVRDYSDRPINNAELVPFGMTGDEYDSRMTDYNGFYWATCEFGDYVVMSGGSGLEVWIEGVNCTKVRGGDANIGNGDRPNETFVTDVKISDLTYNTNFFTTINVLVQDSSGVPIPGVSVSLQGAKSKKTGNDGYAILFTRSRMLNYGTTTAYKIVVMQNGLCYLTTGSCNPCMPYTDLSLPSCMNGPLLRTVTSIPSFNAPASGRGWSPGGVYPLTVKLIDAAGRETDAEGDWTVKLPSIQEKQKFTFSQIKWQVTGAMNLPSDFVKMAIQIGKNRALEDFVTWVVDKVEFVDSAGVLASNLSADKVLLSIRSLYDHATYFSNTNVKYQYVEGDRLEFIANGDGKIFNLPLSSLNFLIEGDYNNREAVLQNEADRYSKLVISYTKDLSILVEGAEIKLIRPRVCDNDDIYYETCQLIDLQDGEPVTKVGTVSGWDSYFLRRSIKYNDMQHSFSFPFLHHSPSDFWGDHCIDRGRVSAKNPYQKQLQYGRNAMVSQSWLANSNFNGLNYFGSDLQKNFSGEQRGDITAAVSIEQTLMIICEFDNFLSNVADDYVRVVNGQVVAASGDQVVTDAQRKISGIFGCQYEDVSSLVTGEGWVFWVDTFNKAPVHHNWNNARDVSYDRDGRPITKSYFSSKLQYKHDWNQTADDNTRIRIVAGFDPVARNVLVTFFSRQSVNSLDDYAHSRPEIDYSKNETIAYSPSSEEFNTFYSFTPEGYSLMNNAKGGHLFYTFKEGKPFAHRELGLNLFNMFYGRACDEVFEPIVNDLPDKVKRYLVMQQQSRYPYYSDRVITSEGQLSQVPPIRVQKFSEGKYDAEFLRDQNSAGGLYKGNTLYGTWMKVRLIRENSLNFAVGTRDANKQIRYNELDSIIFKFTFSEQSSYNLNNK